MEQYQGLEVTVIDLATLSEEENLTQKVTTLHATAQHKIYRQSKIVFGNCYVECGLGFLHVFSCSFCFWKEIRFAIVPKLLCNLRIFREVQFVALLRIRAFLRGGIKAPDQDFLLRCLAL